MSSRLENAKKLASTLLTRIKELRASKGAVPIDIREIKKDVVLKGKKGIVQPARKAAEVQRILKGHFGKIYAMDSDKTALQIASNLSLDGTAPNGPSEILKTRIISASQDGKLIVWNGYKTCKEHAISLPDSWVTSCVFERTAGALIASAGLNKICYIYKPPVDKGEYTSISLKGHESYISGCRFINDKAILTSSGDRSAILWDIESTKVKQTFLGHNLDILCIFNSPVDNNIFLTGSMDETVRIWDIRAGEAVQIFQNESCVNTLSWFGNGSAFFTGSDDGSSSLFDLRSYSQLHKIQDESIHFGVTSSDISKGNRFLVTGYDNCQAILWDILAEKSLVYPLLSHRDKVSCLSFDNDGQSICTGSWDMLLKIWS